MSKDLFLEHQEENRELSAKEVEAGFQKRSCETQPIKEVTINWNKELKKMKAANPELSDSELATKFVSEKCSDEYPVTTDQSF